MLVTGKGIKGFVPRQAAAPLKASSPTKRSKKPALAKVVVGNKQMMAQESLQIAQSVDDYMREKEVSTLLCWYILKGNTFGEGYLI